MRSRAPWFLAALGLVLVLARRIATRIAFGRRATPYEFLTEFSHRAGETYDIEDVLERMVRIVARAIGPTSAQVILRLSGSDRVAATWGEPSGERHRVAIVHQGHELGALSVTMSASEPMIRSKERLVRDLAAQAGPVLRNVPLIEELRASRQRLVAAQDEERRRLERNIHDGAQQQLVALGVRMRLLDALIERDQGKARELVAQLRSDATQALDDLRNLARGIYPPLLADKGLPAALEAQARKAPVPVEVDSDSVGRYPQEVEAAVYFCALEALNNVAKYAGASRASIRLAQPGGHFVFEITDDGAGFDPERAVRGLGLQSMADRLEAIGGELEITSAPGAGTTVRGAVPVPASAGAGT